MLTAITRPVSPQIHECDLGHMERQPIDVRLAAEQHEVYERLLAVHGARVIRADAKPELPDGVFVEDPVVVVDEVAVMTRMQSEVRRREGASLERALAPFRPIRRLSEPATLEGGDVIRIGRHLYVGLSGRTTAQGIGELAAELTGFGYTVEAVRMQGCLHLKSACCYLGNHTVVANPKWVDLEPFAGLRVIEVAEDEPAAANVLAIGDGLIIPAAFPATAEILERAGWRVSTVDVSELQKAEAGVTCCSVIF